MKIAWLLHGIDGNNTDYYWFKDAKAYLESKGYHVWWPLLPGTDKPSLEETRDYIEDNMPTFNEEMIIIGHSSACPVILHMMQFIKVPVKQVILVSGFYQPIDDKGFSEQMLQAEEYDWEAIKQAAKEIIFINSASDPWGRNDTQARPVAYKLGARLVSAEEQGDMRSGSSDQSYREFKLLKELLRV